MGLARQRHGLRSASNGQLGLTATRCLRNKGDYSRQLQRMAVDGETVAPSLPEPGMWTGMARANVLGPLRGSARKSIEARGVEISGRIMKPDIRQQL